MTLASAMMSARGMVILQQESLSGYRIRSPACSGARESVFTLTRLLHCALHGWRWGDHSTFE